MTSFSGRLSLKAGEPSTLGPGLLHKCEALRGSRIKPQHYALVIRRACGGIIIISADQKITNNNDHG